MKSNLRTKRLYAAVLCFLILVPLKILSGFSQEADDAGRVTINFIDADVRYVLDTLARQENLHIVFSDEVKGNVNVRLDNVLFWDAFRTILEAKGLGYEKIGEIVKVATFEELKSQRESKEEEISRMRIEVFRFKYANAKEIDEVVKKFLSSKGSTAVYYSTIRGGWAVGGISSGETATGIVARIENKKEEFPGILVVRDFPEYLDKIRELLEEFDRLPKQVLIRALIVEVKYDREKDIGINWETLGQAGAEGDSSFIVGEGKELEAGIKGGTPPSYQELTPDFTGLTLTYRRLIGARFEAVIYALEEEGKANVLSSPRMLVLDGHEGTILVGSKYPIFSTSFNEQGELTGESLDRYEPIGVTLKVIPVIWEGGRVNMAIHPMISALGGNVTGNKIIMKEIITREVDTNVTVNSGDTIVIGGLIKSEDTTTQYRVPLLGQIPILGWFFRRENKTVEKTELLIFITPSIVEEAVLADREGAKLKEAQQFLSD